MAAKTQKNSSWQLYLFQLPFWSALVLLVMATLLVLAIRFLVPQIDLARPYLETWLSDRLPFDVEISHLSGSLFKIDPTISIDKLTLTSHQQKFLVIEEVYFEIDTLASLMAGRLRMKDTRFAGLELWLEENPEGWQLEGWQKQLKTNDKPKESGVTDNLRHALGYVEQLLVQGELSFSDLRFNFSPLDDDLLFFSAESMNYRRWAEGRQFSFQLEASTQTTEPAELVITLEGEQFNPKTSNLSAWFNFPLVSLDDFQALWPSYMQVETQNIQGQFSVEGWFSLKKGQTQLDLQARNVELVRDQLWQLEFDSADITLIGELDNWSADWRINNLSSSDYFFEELAGRLGQEQKNSYLQLEKLPLDALFKQLQQDARLPIKAQEILADLAPGGNLINLLLTRDAVGEIDLQANLQEVKVAPWEGAPQGAGLYAWLQADFKGGQVVFAETPLQLGFPKLYTPLWNLSAAKGAVRWELEGNKLWVIGEDLAVVLPIDKASDSNAYVSGEFAFYYTPDDQRFYLNLGLLAVEVAAHQQLVPNKLLEPELMKWLTSALQAGQVNQAGFIYAGPIGSQATFQLVADYEATRFKFQPDWPYLSQASGHVQVMDTWVKGQVKSAKLGSGQLRNANFLTTTNKAGKISLKATSKIQAPLKLFPWLVKNSPLKTEVPEAIQSWKYLGQIKGGLSLDIPLSETKQLPRVELQSQIYNGELTLSQADLTLTKINGPLNFTLAKGLESSGLIGQVMDQPITAVFYTEPENYLSFSAGVAGKGIKQYFHLPEALELTGVTQVLGRLPLIPIGLLEVTSDLQGLALTTPLPWNKKSTDKLDFNLQVDFAAEELPLRLKFSDQADYISHLDNPARGSHLQLAETSVAKAVLPEEPGLALSIKANQINAEPIFNWFKQLVNYEIAEGSVAAPTKELQALNRVDLNISQLNWNDLELGQAAINLQNLTEGLRLKFSAAISEGEVWWPSQPEQQLEVLISYLHLPLEDKPKEEATSKRANRLEKTDLLADYNPQLLPAMLVKIDDFRLGNKRFGALTAQAKSIQEGVSFNPLQIDLEETHLTAQLDWLLKDNLLSTHIQGSVVGKNIEPALKALTGENKAPIVSGKHKLNFTAGWLGSPIAFDLQEVNAELQLELKDGYFPKTDLALSGISQVFGLLNMDTLLRRLRLDFSDLKAKGVSYDSIKGKYQLDDGYLRTNEPTRVVSSATRMTLKGEVDLIEETLEQELLIVLPVAQSLPLAAVLVGAPQVGAAIWVVQKVFSNLFDTFTEARYKVTGPLSDPKVELQRVF